MSKYAPLSEFLRGQKGSNVPMTFAEIERIIGSALPASQKYPAWWSNNPTNNVMTKFWLDAGFMTEQVDVERRKLVFRRCLSSVEPKQTRVPSGISGGIANRGTSVHPLFEALKGTVNIPNGVDLTEPADPEWGGQLSREP